jgi:hypothetical protein
MTNEHKSSLAIEEPEAPVIKREDVYRACQSLVKSAATVRLERIKTPHFSEFVPFVLNPKSNLTRNCSRCIPESWMFEGINYDQRISVRLLFVFNSL